MRTDPQREFERVVAGEDFALSTRESLAIEHDGVQARVSGASAQDNPYLRAEAMPAATGEPLGLWRLRHDAWARGYEHVDRSDVA